MSKVIYMDSTIQQIGKQNPKKAQSIIDMGEVIHFDEGYTVQPYLIAGKSEVELKKENKRRTLDGNILTELDEPIELLVKTKVPSKWILQDTETGDIYRGTTNTTIGEQWEKLAIIKE